jgi:hypothetical protein
MLDWQMWLVSTLSQVRPVGELMRTAWAWPIAESVHFIGLCLLIGTVGMFDLRLLGLATRIPIWALHRLIPIGLVGFGLNAVTGAMFLMTEPDQYIYNPAFHIKMGFIMAAGVNALMFYVTSYREVNAPGSSLDAPRAAKIIATISFSLWMGVIIAGRLLTFYRPSPCEPGAAEVLSTCLPGYEGQYDPVK